MSIVSMVDNKVASVAGPPAAGTSVGVPSNIVNQLVAYIPTEIITIWVALIAVLNDPQAASGQDDLPGRLEHALDAGDRLRRARRAADARICLP